MRLGKEALGALSFLALAVVAATAEKPLGHLRNELRDVEDSLKGKEYESALRTSLRLTEELQNVLGGGEGANHLLGIVVMFPL